MVSADFKKMAREKLTGKWETAVVMFLLYGVITSVISYIQLLIPEESFLYSLYSIGVTIINVPLSFGLVFAFYKLFYGENVKSLSFWSIGFDNFGRSWSIAFRAALKLIGPYILLIISLVFLLGTSIFSLATISTQDDSFSIFSLLFSFALMIISIIWLIAKSYYYSLSQFIAFDNPKLTAKECVEKSKELMTNRRGKLICLQFSFIGWIILATFTLGIGFLWLTPYMQMATIAFYHVVANKENIELQENN